MPTKPPRGEQLHPGAPDEADYHAFCTALSESARGRGSSLNMPGATAMPTRGHFKRDRAAADFPCRRSVGPAEVLIKQKLRALLDDITSAQTEIEASVMAIRTAKLADLIARVEHRLVETWRQP